LYKITVSSVLDLLNPKIFPYLIPANAMAVVYLKRLLTFGLIDIISVVGVSAMRLVEELEEGIRTFGITYHPMYVKI
jgi:meiotically up-regulated gene 157 (Mug157) protein